MSHCSAPACTASLSTPSPGLPFNPMIQTHHMPQSWNWNWTHTQQSGMHGRCAEANVWPQARQFDSPTDAAWHAIEAILSFVKRFTFMDLPAASPAGNPMHFQKIKPPDIRQTLSGHWLSRHTRDAYCPNQYSECVSVRQLSCG